MPKEKIMTKLTDLSQRKEQLVAQLNAIVGAEQILNELLGELEQGGDKNGDDNRDD